MDEQEKMRYVCSICNTEIDQTMIVCPGCGGILQWGWMKIDEFPTWEKIMSEKRDEAMVDLWVKDDAPDWVREKVKEELRKQKW